MGFFDRFKRKPQPQQEAPKPPTQDLDQYFTNADNADISGEFDQFMDGAGQEQAPDRDDSRPNIDVENVRDIEEARQKRDEEVATTSAIDERHADFERRGQERIMEAARTIEELTGLVLTPEQITDPELAENLGFQTAQGDFRYTKKISAIDQKRIVAQLEAIQRDYGEIVDQRMSA